MKSEERACPCLHTTPCDPRCTCVMPASSSGCLRCCTYGSPEQQRSMAEWLADAEQRGYRAALEAVRQREILDKLKEMPCSDQKPK